MPTQYLIYLVALLLTWNLFLQWQTWQLQKKFKILFNGQKASDLEGVLFEQIKRLRKNEDNFKELSKFAKDLEKMALKSVQKVGIIRFNPFKDTGGNQSFAIALMDAIDDGLVLSTLFTREGVRVYAKPIEKGESNHALSEEEITAIKKAQSNK